MNLHYNFYDLYGVNYTMTGESRHEKAECHGNRNPSLLPTPVRIPGIDLRMISLEIHLTPGSPPEISHKRNNEGSEEQHEADDHDEIPIWGIDTFDGLVIDRILSALMRYSDIDPEQS